MTFILVNKKDISGRKIVKSIIYQKLLAAGYRKINLITVMNMNGHRLFIIVQMGSRKCLGIQAGLNRSFAGITYLPTDIIIEDCD